MGPKFSSTSVISLAVLAIASPKSVLSIARAIIISSFSAPIFSVSWFTVFSSSGWSIPRTVPMLTFESSAVIMRVAGLKIVSVGLIFEYANEFAYAMSASLSGYHAARYELTYVSLTNESVNLSRVERRFDATNLSVMGINV